MILVITPRFQPQNNQVKNVAMKNYHTAKKPMSFGSSVPIVHPLDAKVLHVLTRIGQAMQKAGKDVLELTLDGHDVPFIALTRRTASRKIAGDFELVRRIGKDGGIQTKYSIDSAEHTIEVSGLTDLGVDVNQEVTKYSFSLAAEHGIAFQDIYAGFPI